MNTNQLIDTKTFAQLKELDAPGSDFLLNLQQIFSEQGVKLIAEIHEAVAQTDAASLQKAAHTLKGASLNIGAVVLGQHCLELEKYGKAGTIPPNANELLQQLTKLFDESKEALQMLIHDSRK